MQCCWLMLLLLQPYQFDEIQSLPIDSVCISLSVVVLICEGMLLERISIWHIGKDDSRSSTLREKFFVLTLVCTECMRNKTESFCATHLTYPHIEHIFHTVYFHYVFSSALKNDRTINAALKPFYPYTHAENKISTVKTCYCKLKGIRVGCIGE